ncbi:MAG TPA: hypothetical protein VHU18_11715 [Rhizomicrobium sp.]|nr:hypothetical protein [Rhizomicrobium sp.]
MILKRRIAVIVLACGPEIAENGNAGLTGMCTGKKMTMKGAGRKSAGAVVAGGELNGLGVARSLGAARVPFVLLDTHATKPAFATRFGKKCIVRALHGPEFVEDLLAVASRFSEKPVLILTEERSVVTVSSAREQLADAFHLTLPARSLTEDLLDKMRFQRLAERHGLSVPRAISFGKERREDPLSNLRFPCVLKPTAKSAEYDRHFAKAYKVSAPSEVEDLWSRMREVIDELIVQEWIEGADSDVYFCLQYRGSESPSCSFVGRKICQWPPLVGGTASCIPAPEAAAALISATDKFFEAVGFFGIGSMEFKRDRRDGQFYAVEPTVGRTDYQEEIATLNGVNIPFAAYCGAFGQLPPPRGHVDPPAGWRDPFGYAKARLAGAPDPVVELNPRIDFYDAYFRASDPMPFLKLKLPGLKRRLRRHLITHG